jgi:hypothetical protein
MNFSLELKFFILSHPVTSKQPHKIVQILMGHPVHTMITTHYTLDSGQEISEAIYLGFKSSEKSTISRKFHFIKVNQRIKFKSSPVDHKYTTF